MYCSFFVMFVRVLKTISESVHRNISRNITVMAESERQNVLGQTCQKQEGAMIWIDLELTGLDIDSCHILEVACLVSDKDLNIIGDELHLVIHQPNSVLDNMNEWCINMHRKTGLTKACQQSNTSIKDAEQLLLSHIKKYARRQKCFMAGNTVYMDRIFMNKYMPSVNDYLHYRLIDVSTIKELTRMWKPDVQDSVPAKTLQHKAMSDIKESINELKYYRRCLFQ